MNKIRISGAIASQTGITLYLENGAELNLPKDSWRTKAILDEALEALARHEVVELDLDTFSIERRIEKKTNGFVRFFRKVGEALGLVHSGGVGNPPADPEREVLVAVVKGKEIPGVEALERQLERAAFTGNTDGLQKFLERIAAVIDDRGHTVDELLNFMRRADLPIADDGSIVAYKVLRSSGRGDNRFVDCYTGRVSQALGSHVSQAKVDPSRRTECSTGLHIARRGYLRRFHGDIITLVKIAPEDVIAVPQGEPDKMRVAAYHIVGVLPAEVHPVLRSNQPMTDNTVAAKMLADVIAGNHVGVVEYVKIGGPMGSDVTIEPVAGARKAPKPFQNGEAKALDDSQVISVKEIRETVDKVVSDQKTSQAEKPAEPVEKPKASKKIAAKKVSAAPTKKSKPKAKSPSKPAAKAETAKQAKELPEKYQQALKMLADGKSQREVQRELRICRKTLRKLQKERGQG